MPTYLDTNLTRLFGLHALSNRDAAKLLGASPQAISAWTVGNRMPSAEYLLAIGRIFEVNPTALLDLEPHQLVESLADPQRFRRVEQRIREEVAAV
jgi:transcriptional regulator with XRE-family HTH domain